MCHHPSNSYFYIYKHKEKLEITITYMVVEKGVKHKEQKVSFGRAMTQALQLLWGTK